MSKSDNDQSRLTTRTGQLIRRCLRGCRYHDDLIAEDYALAPGRNIPVIAFAHRPHDARSSCIAFLPESRTPQQDLSSLHELGVPLAFIAGDKTWEMWSLRRDGPRRDQTIPWKDVEQFFDSNKNDFAPGAVFRAKTWARAEGARQLDFVDTGLLPIVEMEAGTRLCRLFVDMVEHSMGGKDPSSLGNYEAHLLMKANFWLLAGKLLRDKQVEKFKQLDLHDVQNVFARVAEHYGSQPIPVSRRLAAWRGAADVAAKFSSFRNISTETLGALYEGALLSKRARKLWSIHRTPTYLVDFTLAKLSRWMADDIGIQNCRVFEPACGHAPFLVGAVRLLSDLLPASIASDRKERRSFLRTHLGGCDSDSSVALEVARLSLTLADIPNANGWTKLDPVQDMYAGDYLSKKIAANSVIIANPPFESVEISDAERAAGDLRYARSGQAGELLRRIVIHACPGTLFGLVVPQTLLDGASFKELRRNLLSSVEIREIVTFPDNVFKFAKPETALIIGKKLGDGRSGADAFKFRRILKPEMDAFRNENRLPSGASFTRSEALRHPRHRLILPPLAGVWQATSALPRMKEIAHVSIGFYFYPERDPKFPKGEVQVSDKERPGFRLGFRSGEKTPDTHLLPKMEWLNQKPEIIEWECGGTVVNQPQILLNKVRASRSRWRLKAFIDSVGRPYTDRFICFRPIDDYSLAVLWAIVNSPFANAHTFAESPKADFSPARLRGLPIPELGKRALAPLENSVQAYLAAAGDFSARFGRSATRTKKHAKNSKPAKTIQTPELPLEGIDSDESSAESTAHDHLRALHWRVDAEVLKFYALPAGLERELLDFFDGVARVGVPFEQKSYIPSGFREVQRLDDYLRITDEWEQTDDRRCQFIEKRIKRGHRTPAEEAEFKELQRLFDLRRSYCRWMRTGDANTPIFDEAKLRQLQEEDARWPEE